MVELHENLDILVPMDSWNPNFNDGSKSIREILISIYYVIHN
jgi:hypothetical protein